MFSHGLQNEIKSRAHSLPTRASTAEAQVHRSDRIISYSHIYGKEIVMTESHGLTGDVDLEFSFSEDRGYELMLLGGFLGAFHVLTPDHLSALSALSVGGSWSAFYLGVRWSMGHSSGLLVVTFFFIMLKGDLDLHYFGRYCDVVVGLFMIMIGGYGIMGHARQHHYKLTKREDLDVKDIVEQDRAEEDVEGGEKKVTEPEGKDLLELMVHNHDVAIPYIDMSDNTTQRAVSVAMGLLHGVAGPGGILGVLPALELQHWQSSTIYLGSFIIASTISMGIFAAAYGEGTKRLGASSESLELALRLVSSSASVLVGLIWIAVTVSGWADAGDQKSDSER